MARRKDKDQRRRDEAGAPIAGRTLEQRIAPAWWYWTAAFVLALAAAILIYSPAAQGPFVWDDRYQYFGRPEAAQYGFAQWVANVRPFLNATFWLNYQISGTETGSYHAVNVLLHALNTMLVLILSRRLWRLAGGARDGLGSAGDWAPIFAAGLFLLHPMQTESVAYVSSRSETLSVLFAYAALALQLTAPDGPLSWPRIVGMLGALGAAVATKEHTAAMPAIFAITDFFWRGGWQGVRENWRLHASMVVAGLAGLAFVARTLSISPSAGFGLKEQTPLVYLFTQFRMFWRYVRMLVFPVGLNIDPDIELSRSVADPAALAGLAGIIAVIAGAWWLRKRSPLASYGIFVFGILLAPTSSFIPILDAFAERRVYLPMFGICCLALAAFRQWRIPAAASAVLLALWSYGSFARNAVWATEQALWENSVAGAPNKFRPRFQLAYARYLNRECAGAADDFAAAEKLAGNQADVTLYVDWALALDCAGKQGEALTQLKRAAELEDSASVRAQTAMMQAKLGNLSQALDELARAESLDPRFAMTYVYRGNVYVLQGRREEARAEFQKALAIEPDNQAAVQGLAAAQ